MKQHWAVIPLLVFVSACTLACSAEGVPPATAPVAIDAGVSTDTSMVPTDSVQLSIRLVPNQATYAIGKEVTVNASITRNGETMDTSDWTVKPEGFGERVSENALRLTDPGSGTIELCAGDVCTQTPIFVVDQPVIQLTYPARGEMIRLDATNTVMVAGRLENMPTGFPTVLANGQPATLTDDFEFSLPLLVNEGLNPLEIQVQEPTLANPPSLYTQFLAAQNFLPKTDGPLRIPEALTVYLRESLLDSNQSRVIIEPGASVVATDVVQFLDVIVQASDPLRWLPTPLTDFEGLDLEITDIDFGHFDGDITLPGSLAEASFAMQDATVQTRGAVRWMGTDLDLDGYLTASLSAFLVLDGSITDTILLDLQEIEAELISVAAHYQSEALNSLIEALDSELTDQVIQVLTSFIKDLFKEQALPLVQYSFEEMLEQIKVLPITVESPLEGVPAVNLTAEVLPRSMELYQRYAELLVDVEISAGEQHDHEGDLGVFVSPAYPTPGQSTDPLTLVVKLDLLNALCHSIWKTGLLNISPELPEALSGLIESATVDAKLPPVIEFNSGATNLFTLRIAELQLAVTPAGRAQSDLYVLHLSVPATLNVNGGFISLTLDGTPSIRVDPLLKSGRSPINAQTIESLLLGVIYPLFEAALSDGLTYGIDAIPIDRALLNDIAPLLADLVVRPQISTNFSQEPGVITVGGQLSAEARRHAEAPPNVE